MAPCLDAGLDRAYLRTKDVVFIFFIVIHNFLFRHGLFLSIFSDYIMLPENKSLEQTTMSVYVGLTGNNETVGENKINQPKEAPVKHVNSLCGG
jgi:hypothetical protein